MLHTFASQPAQALPWHVLTAQSAQGACLPVHPEFALGLSLDFERSILKILGQGSSWAITVALQQLFSTQPCFERCGIWAWRR